MLNTERLCLGCMNDNGGESVCSICGYDSKQANDKDFLQTHTWLNNRYLIGNAFESNGEGVTYIGWDNSSNTIVNVREYFPKGAAQRNSDGSVSIAAGNEFTFNEGIMNFLELNRKLASLSGVPALLETVEVFETNGTAYAVTKAVQGITLREFLIRNGGNLKWEQARPLFLPLITTVAAMHEVGIIHRGISPETIIVGRDGKLRLTGICIRPVRMSKSNMTIQLFPGYSAVEQYGYDIESRDGKYTDVYGMAATLFRVLMGKAPTDVTERISNDSMEIPSRYAETLPKFVLSSLANALQIMPENRTQDMDAFRISLTPVSGNTATVTRDFSKTQVVSATDKTDAKPPKKDSSGKKYAIIASAVTATVIIILALVLYFVFGTPKQNTEDPSSSSGSSTPPVSSETQGGEIVTPSEIGDNLYQVPDLIGKKYSDIVDKVDYKTFFTFEVVDKDFSDKYPRGYIIEQTPTSDQSVKKGTNIQIVLSLGPRTVAVPDLVGKTADEARFELMKLGFDYNNISVIEVYDADKEPNTVIAVEPGIGTRVDADAHIQLRVNSAAVEDTTSSDSSSATE